MEFIWLYLLALTVGVALGKTEKLKPVSKALPYVTGMLIFIIGVWAGNEIRSLMVIASLVLGSLEILIPSTLAGYIIALGFERKTSRKRGSYSKRAKAPFLFLSAAILGWALGSLIVVPSAESLVTDLLITLVIVIGIDMGPSITISSFKRDLKNSWIPFSALSGALIGGLISSAVFGINVKFALASSAGMGWYSLDGPLLSSIFGPDLGMIAFLSNFLREQLTFFLVPLLRNQKGVALLTLGGCTTMDDTLSLYASTLGDEYKELALFNGLILSLIIPFLIPGILAL